jgi:hypothetical protein
MVRPLKEWQRRQMEWSEVKRKEREAKEKGAKKCT